MKAFKIFHTNKKPNDNQLYSHFNALNILNNQITLSNYNLIYASLIDIS